jgi:two-component system, OmpR family, sensor histidine kinase SenX3
VRRRKTAIFFLILGIALSILAIVLNVGWIILNLREVALLILGVIFFALIITGLILNTIFLLREIRRNEQHDAFLNSVTHELKTPIASIKLYLETLRTREVTEAKRREFYDVMLADSDRLLDTVEQVLHAGRMREKSRQLTVSDVDIADVLRDSIGLVRSRYNLADGVIRLAEIPPGTMVLADPEELKTAFVNLLDNSIKYSEEDPRISIRAKSTALNNRVAIVIRDNGIGIPPADLKRVFKRFYRVPESGRARKGTGLGLFIVKGIIEKHGGRITAESKGVGLGSTFIVQLPLA